MYELKISKLFRKQIKNIAIASQPLFQDISESWDNVHRIINKLEKDGNPFDDVKFVARVDKKTIYLVYRLDKKKQDLWVEAIVTKINGKFVIYKS